MKKALLIFGLVVVSLVACEKDEIPTTNENQFYQNIDRDSIIRPGEQRSDDIDRDSIIRPGEQELG